MKVNTNINAMYATNSMTKNTAAAGNSMQKLSSGLRINKAKDDAAGLAVSEKMRAQIRGMEQADRNVQDGISLVQTAEGALSEAGSIAQRMRELAVQGANGTLSESDRDAIELELTQLHEEIEAIADETKFNGNTLLEGTNTKFTIQAGATDEIREIDMVDLKTIIDAVDLGTLTNTDESTYKDLVGSIDTALDAINGARATLGSQQNRLEATSSNLTTNVENTTEAESRIRDVDVAKEMTNLAKLNLLTQVSQAMTSQANSQPEGITQLLR